MCLFGLVRARSHTPTLHTLTLLNTQHTTQQIRNTSAVAARLHVPGEWVGWGSMVGEGISLRQHDHQLGHRRSSTTLAHMLPHQGGVAERRPHCIQHWARRPTAVPVATDAGPVVVPMGPPQDAGHHGI